jgi:inorganic pyrophosphatase
MLDGGEADDKIIGVLAQDMIWSHVEDLDELPQALVQRLRHYFTTYKMMPGDTTQQVSIDHIYDRAHAEKVILAAMADYDDEFGGA